MKYKVDIAYPTLSSISPILTPIVLLNFSKLADPYNWISFSIYMLIIVPIILFQIKNNKKYKSLTFSEHALEFQGANIYPEMIKRIHAYEWRRNMIIHFNERRVSIRVSCRKENKSQFFQELKHWAFKNHVSYEWKRN